MTSELETVIANYAAGPGQLREAILGMTPEQLAARPIAGKWSTQEVVCHITDFEIINAYRIQRTIAEPNAQLINADPDDFAANLSYAYRDVAAELDLITALRGHIITLLKQLTPEQWSRTGTHSTDGPITVRQLVERTTRHIPHHIPFIAEKRAAQK